MTATRIAAHVHSEWSHDGHWSLPEIVRAFARRRYDAVLMAEHDKTFDEEHWSAYRAACQAASTPELLLVPGIEYEDSDGVVHTPVWGPDMPFLGRDRPTLDVLQEARDHGALAVFAHPWRRGAVDRFQPEWAPLLTAVEIWNRKYDGAAPSRPALDLARRHDVAPWVALDFHSRRQFFPLALRADVQGDLATRNVLGALATGAVQPEMLGLSALRFTQGMEGTLARTVERMRAVATLGLRRIERWG